MAFGTYIVLLTGSSVVGTLIVPRSLQSVLPRYVARYVIRLFHFLARRFDTYEARDKVLAFQAPTFLLTLLFTWIVLFLFGYALILWPFIGKFLDSVVESGSSLFTLGFARTHAVGADLISAPPGPWSGPRGNLPGMQIIPERPADRTPEDPRAEVRPRGMGSGY
ncbi:MAG TPA: hypothetical protein VG929_04730 [Actinomycetota bacterium]|nr:hypothetical protein [Actinomycetota bacterium]